MLIIWIVMEDSIRDYLDSFEKKVMNDVLRYLSNSGILNRKLLESDDINAVWESVAPFYIADSVKEIAKYPNVALGWAMYLGMAVAKYWDDDWERYGNNENIYYHIRDIRGFDFMDEVVRADILGLSSDDYDNCEEMVRKVTDMVLSGIRHEQIEPQSPMAFHVFARSIRVLYKIGASVTLKSLGYRFERSGN